MKELRGVGTREWQVPVSENGDSHYFILWYRQWSGNAKQRQREHGCMLLAVAIPQELCVGLRSSVQVVGFPFY